MYELCARGVLAASITALYSTVQILIDSVVYSVKHVHLRDKPWIEDFNRSKQPTLQRDEKLGDPAGAFITVPLLTRGQFHEQPQRQMRSRPRGSECSSSAGGTSPSPERNLGNRPDRTAPIITFGVTKGAAPGRDCHHVQGFELLYLASCDDCSFIVCGNYKP